MGQTTVLANRYVVPDSSHAVLGVGGMGVVVQAIDLLTKALVAVKLLKSSGKGAPHDQMLLQRFVREGEALRQLNHPNVVKLLDTFEENGRRYLVMELVTGGSLRDLLERGEQLSLHRFLHLALDICDALTRAHRLDIVHRDLKPDNVLLDEHGVARLTDFGIAHFEDRTVLTGEGSLLGTLPYMSPEACEGEPAAPAQDIWSFGVMLYELLGRELPFQGSSPASLITAILRQPLPSVRRLRPGAPQPLVELLERMLERDLARRCASLREVGLELERLRGHPAFQPGAPEPAATPPPARPAPAPPPAPASRPAPAPGPAFQSALPLRLHLVKNPKNNCSLTLQDLTQVLEAARQIWTQHGLSWTLVGCQQLTVDDSALEATYPNHSESRDPRPNSCEALLSLPGYDPQALNVYVTGQLPYHNKELLSMVVYWRPQRVVVVPERYFQEPPGHTLARALGCLLGLRIKAGTPGERLVALNQGGTELTAEERAEVDTGARKLLAALAPPATGSPGPELILPFQVLLVRSSQHGSQLTSAQARQLLAPVQACWTRAGLRLQLEFHEAAVPDADLEAFLPNDDTVPASRKPDFIGLARTPGYRTRGLHLFWLAQLTSVGRARKFASLQYKAHRAILVKDQTTPREIARALGLILGLQLNDYAGPERLLGSGTGEELSAEEVEVARESARIL